jgi:hypothetical protein
MYLLTAWVCVKMASIYNIQHCKKNRCRTLELTCWHLEVFVQLVTIYSVAANSQHQKYPLNHQQNQHTQAGCHMNMWHLRLRQKGSHGEPTAKATHRICEYL